MVVRVFDSNGNEKDWQWAVDRYGVRLVETEPPAGVQTFRLVELRQKLGPCGQMVKVLDESGAPLEGVAVLQGWVDGAVLPDDAAPRLSVDVWAQPEGKPNRGNGGFTNSNGDFGWGWGPGEQYDPSYQDGAHWYWIMGQYTDVTLGYGWLFGTDHDTLNIVFQREISDVEPPSPSEEPPEPPEDGDLAAVVEAIDALTAQVKRAAEALLKIAGVFS